MGREEVWGCWWRCVGQLDAFWAFKNSQGGEILGTATKSYRLRIYGEPSAAHLVPFYKLIFWQPAPLEEAVDGGKSSPAPTQNFEDEDAEADGGLAFG